MPALTEVILELRKVHPPTAELLDHTLEHIPVHGRIEWAARCLEIANSGWHAFESANAFILSSPIILASYDFETLIARGDYGLQFCGYSFEPGFTYYCALGNLVVADVDGAKWNMLPEVEAAGRTILGKFQHASNLLTDFFEIAFAMLLRENESEIRAWCALAAKIAHRERQDLIVFLGSRHESICWQEMEKLERVSPNSFLFYLSVYEVLEAKFGLDLMADLQPLILGFADDEDALQEFLLLLPGIQTISRNESRSVFSLIPEIGHVDLVTSFVSHCHELPLGDLPVIQQWIAGGVQVASTNIDAGLAFFSLESSTSVELLESLRGQINFADCSRVMQLYTEAMTGKRLRVESTADSDVQYRDMPHTLGASICLPESVSWFASKDENFEFYKVALLHQLGFFEYQTFVEIEFIETTLTEFEDSVLAHGLFNILEAARIDWLLARHFRGIRDAFSAQKSFALDSRQPLPIMRKAQLLELMIRAGLDAGPLPVEVNDRYLADAVSLYAEVLSLDRAEAQLQDTLSVLQRCYVIVSEGDQSQWDGAKTELDDGLAQMLEEELPQPISFHGHMDTRQLAMDLALVDLEDTTEGVPDDSVSMSTALDPADLDIDEIQDGDVQDGLGMLATEIDHQLENVEKLKRENEDENRQLLPAQLSNQVREDQRFRYDEWDFVINDYRRRWCTLYEVRDCPEAPEYVDKTLAEHGDVASRVRKQLTRLKPEMLRKVKGVVDGDDLDLDRAVEAVIDRKTGLTPAENIYTQSLRKDRDVSALFLLDMSASTDDIIADGSEPPPFSVDDDDEDILSHYASRQQDESSRTRIIDIEKQAVILMAEALEQLGDNYSICGFSGYGRERVDYFLCKDFGEAYDHRARGKIGGIKPCRSTRMGPAIRHATRSLVKTESRIRALIIISDGYPQDHDYGQDRNSRDYGVKDTMKALAEARTQNVQTFCLTVDQSGHDYLREMCPDKQYLVIQEVSQLPDELSKVYQSLTG